MKVITKPVAEKYLSVLKQIQELYDSAPVGEGGYKEVAQGELEPLETFREMVLACNAIEDDAALVLSSCGDGLRLHGLKMLSESSAIALAQHKGGALSLGGLINVSERALCNLATHKELALSLPTITPKAARALSRHGHSIELRETTELSQELASALGSCRGELYLNALKSEHEVANLLERRPKGRWTTLRGFTSVSDELAAAISRAKCWVDLQHGVTLSAEAAQRLLDSRNADVYRSWSWLRKAAKTVAKRSADKHVKPGCPAQVFKHINGGLLAVRATPAAVRQALSAGKATAGRPELVQDIGLIEEAGSMEWTLAHCTLVADPVVGLSKVLQTQVAYLTYDDTSGVMSYQLYDCGTMKEEEVLDCEANKTQERAFKTSVDRRFKALGIRVPVVWGT